MGGVLGLRGPEVRGWVELVQEGRGRQVEVGLGEVSREVGLAGGQVEKPIGEVHVSGANYGMEVGRPITTGEFTCAVIGKINQQVWLGVEAGVGGVEGGVGQEALLHLVPEGREPGHLDLLLEGEADGAAQIGQEVGDGRLVLRG